MTDRPADDGEDAMKWYCPTLSVMDGCSYRRNMSLAGPDDKASRLDSASPLVCST